MENNIKFEVGNLVQVISGFQESPPGWDENMAVTVGKIGRIANITSEGLFRVEFPEINRAWVYPKRVLVSVKEQFTFRLDKDPSKPKPKLTKSQVRLFYNKRRQNEAKIST